jgi:hypothetical protein
MQIGSSYGSRCLAAAAFVVSLAAIDRAAAMEPADFDADGVDDFAIGVPREDEGGLSNSGVVLVVLGDSAGLDEGEATWLVAPTTGSGYAFGNAVAWGDFDVDGADDLAVGAPGGGRDGRGMVTIFWGEDGVGLTQTNHTNLFGFQAGEHFGFSIAVGRFDDDIADDLAIGAPEHSGGNGRVEIYVGAEGRGFTSMGSFVGAHTGRLGYSVATGDFGGPPGTFAPRDDLAIGEPERDGSGLVNYGAVYVFYSYGDWGWGDGEVLTEDVALPYFEGPQRILPGNAQSYDAFGYALTSGDFDDDGLGDLVIGVPGQNLSGSPAAGAVHVVFGATSMGVQRLDQNDELIGAPDPYDQLGATLATGDFDADGVTDLAIGVPGELAAGLVGAGGVHVLYGTDGAALSPVGANFWNRDVAGVLGSPEEGDAFGTTLTVGNFDGQDGEDLAIGVPMADVYASLGGALQANAGSLNVLYSGGGAGLSTAGDEIFDQSDFGENANTNDRFGGGRMIYATY